MMGNTEQPCAEFCTRLISLPGPINSEKYFLRKILSLVMISDEMFQNCQQPVLVAQNQFLEGRGIACADFQHESDIRIAQGVMPGCGFPHNPSSSHGALLRR
jgi:hypothetical protein